MRHDSRAARFVAWTLRHGRILWAVALLLCVPAAVRMVSLYAHLRSDLDALLPPEAASVVAIRELRTRMPGLQYLGVLIDVGDAKNLPQGEKLLDDLAARVRAYPSELVRSVRTGVAEERAFVKKYAPLYLDLADLVTIHERIEARKDWEAGQAFGADLSGDPAPAVDFTDLEQKYAAKDTSAGRFPNDRFSSAEQRTTLMLIEVGGFDTGVETAQRLLGRVQSDLAALGGPSAYAPGMRVGYTGDVAISVEEMSALVSDLTVSSLLVVVAVIAALVTYYRWWRSVPILIAPLLVATILTFGLVTLPPFRIHELNSNTAFLGSIIIGNGINFGIVLLARYVEDRRGGASVGDALVTGVAGTRLGTLSAALAASVAYASLIITNFRGFRQFGIIGGVGMVLCWLAAFVLTPPLVAWLDRGPSTAPRPRATSRGIMTRVAAIVARFPRAVVAGALIVTALAAWKVRTMDRTSLELDFSRLRRADTFVNGEGYWGRRMDDLLGRYLSPTVILTDSPTEARAVAAKLREAVKHPPLVDVTSSVSFVDDVLPTQQSEKLAEVEAIRALLTPRVLASVPPERRGDLDRLLGAGTLAPISAADLPATFTVGMRERDGRLDQAVLLYPKPSAALWEGDSLAVLAREERKAVALPDVPHQPRVVGSLLLSADILAAIQDDGPKATVAALVGVVAVVLLLFRRGVASLHVVGALCLGVLWLVALTMLLHVKINFANFIAFPITFGIGVDYAVNVMSRYLQDGSDDVRGAVASTGGAVGLCSLTTIIGYSSLLLAQNRALFSFGVVAVLGEIACLFCAVVVLPAVLLVSRRGQSQPSRRTPRSTSAPHAPATTSSSITPQPEGSRRSAARAGHGLN
jgi:predicted RND superfamily exporter protein